MTDELNQPNQDAAKLAENPAKVEELVSQVPIVDEITEAMDAAAAQQETVTHDLPAENPAPVEKIADESTSPPVTARKTQNVTQAFDMNMPENLERGDEISLPSQFDRETREVLQNLPNINLLGSVKSRDWAETVADGITYCTDQEVFVPTLEDEKSEFTQRMVHNNASLIADVPRHRAIQNEDLKGERALIRLTTHLGLGTLFQVPLWHSGFWITFKPPTDSELVELNRIMTSDKIEFGRHTYGLAFSNPTSYTTDRLVGFALAHLYDTTCKVEDINLQNIRDHISAQDIPSLIWGFICTMYPRGFKYRRACVADPEKCNFILEETLNVSKLQWTNSLSLTDWQRTHMATRQPKSKDLASIVRYKEELSRMQPRTITLNEGMDSEIRMTLKTPSVREFVDAGHRWIANIVSTVDRALTDSSTPEERNALIVQHGQATAMRNYSHWVSSIELSSNTITDRETIDNNLNMISSDDRIREEYTAAIIKFINESTISVIGIPVFSCPSCGKENHAANLNVKGLKNIIPLDVLQVFFGLFTQRLERIAER